MNNNPVKAIALLNNPEKGITGEVFLTEQKSNVVEINVNISGLKPYSVHGFHIHTKGDLRQGCESLCDHWNPYGVIHGGPDDNKHMRHVGDLGNLTANNKGVVHTTFTDRLVKLRGKYSVLGRSFILHEDRDDLGLGNNTESLITGNAGARIACGIIGYAA